MKRIMSPGRLVDKINTWIVKGMALLVLSLLVITLYGVIMRYVFHQPPQWGWQVLLLILVPVAALPGGYVLAVNGHIKLDLLYSRWSTRGQAISDVATFVVFLLFTTMLAYATIKMAWVSASRLEVMSEYAFRGPVYPKKIAIAIGVVLLALQGFVEFARNIRTIRKKKDTGDE